MLPLEQEKWAQEAAGYFQGLGAAGAWGVHVARLYVAFWAAGLNPRITSLFRDPRHQRDLRAQWDRGQREGLRARPADPDTSGHCKTNWLGRPAAVAVDMPTNNDRRAAVIAKSLGVGVGADFRDPDPVHYYLR